MSQLPMEEWVAARKVLFKTLYSSQTSHEKIVRLQEIIREHPDAKEWQDKKGRKPLHIALAKNDLTLFKWLLDAGCQGTQTSEYTDWGALIPISETVCLTQKVVNSGKRDFIIAMLERGHYLSTSHTSDKELQDVIRRGPEFQEAFQGNTQSYIAYKPPAPPSLEEDRKKFFAAIKTDNAEMIEEICRRYKSACDWRDDKGEAAVFVAIAAKSMRVLRKLADMGADLESESKKNSHRPLHRAIHEENVDALHLLVERGAKTGVPLEGFLSYNYPTDMAASKKNQGMMDILRNARQIRQDYLASIGQAPAGEPPKPEKQPRIKKTVAADLTEKFNALLEKVETLENELAAAKKRISDLENPQSRMIKKDAFNS